MTAAVTSRDWLRVDFDVTKESFEYLESDFGGYGEQGYLGAWCKGTWVAGHDDFVVVGGKEGRKERKRSLDTRSEALWSKNGIKSHMLGVLITSQVRRCSLSSLLSADVAKPRMLLRPPSFLLTLLQRSKLRIALSLDKSRKPRPLLLLLCELQAEFSVRRPVDPTIHGVSILVSLIGIVEIAMSILVSSMFSRGTPVAFD